MLEGYVEGKGLGKDHCSIELMWWKYAGIKDIESKRRFGQL